MAFLNDSGLLEVIHHVSHYHQVHPDVARKKAIDNLLPVSNKVYERNEVNPQSRTDLNTIYQYSFL